MAPRLLRPLGDPAVALLWVGLAASAVGDQLFAVVLTWVAVGAFGTASGYLAVLQAAVLLAVTLLAGGWADRRGQMRMMVGADLARAAVLLATVAAWLGAGNPPGWSLVASVLALAAGLALFRPALQATLPHLVRDPSQLPAVKTPCSMPRIAWPACLAPVLSGSRPRWCRSRISSRPMPRPSCSRPPPSPRSPPDVPCRPPPCAPRRPGTAPCVVSHRCGGTGFCGFS